ncbi:MAG: TPM domain-containing protein [Methanosarcinaceae archaeon]
MKPEITKYSLVLIILILCASTATAINYPQFTGFVTDSAEMIDPDYEAKITDLASKIERETTVEIAVVTVKSLEGESKEMYAVKLFEQVGIGKEDKDNGLLILVAEQEREYRFEVGYGLEGVITDSMKVNIGNRIIAPNFKNGEYGKGIYESIVVIEKFLEGDEVVISEYSTEPDGISGGYAFPLLLIGFILIIVFSSLVSNPQKRNHSRNHMYYGGFGGGFGGGGFGGGGFGGFGGGMSGGGGFGGSW